MKYRVLESNIVANQNGISYIYELETFNNIFASTTSNAAKSSMLANIIRSVNMQGEFYLIPFVQDLPEIYNYDNNDNVIKREYKKQIRKQFNERYRYQYRAFIVFKDNAENTFKSKRFSFQLNRRVKEYSKREIEFFNQVNKVNLGKIKEFNRCANVTDHVTTSRLINYLRYNTHEIVEDFSMIECNNYVEYNIETDLGEKEKYFSLVNEIRKFPVQTEEGNEFSFIKDLLVTSYPVDIIIKFEIDLKNAKIERKMKHANNLIRKHADRFETIEGKYLDEYKEKVNLAEAGETAFESSSSSMIEYQMLIRSRTTDENLIDDLYKDIKEILNYDNIKSISSFGKQKLLHEHILLGNLETYEYVHKVHFDYFKELHFLSNQFQGNNVRTTTNEQGLLKFYTHSSAMPVYIDDFAPLRNPNPVNTSSSISIYCGTTGSGKSQIMNNGFLSEVCMNDIKVLNIDPKGDRRGFSKKFPHGEELINEIDISDSRYAGALDPFLKRENDAITTAEVTSLIKFFLELGADNVSFKNDIVSKHLKNYLNTTSKESRYFKPFLEGMIQSGESDAVKIAKLVLSYSSMQYANLYFADEEVTIDYSKNITQIIFDKIDLKNNDITSILMKKVLGSVVNIIKDFMRKNQNSSIDIDECEYLESVTGIDLDGELSKLARSFGVSVNLAYQNFSSIKEGVLNNAGSIFIGSQASDKELEYICNTYNLDVYEFDFLGSDPKDDNVPEEDKYNFLYIDQNNRKSRVKQHFIPMFTKAFNTKLITPEEKLVEIKNDLLISLNDFSKKFSELDTYYPQLNEMIISIEDSLNEKSEEETYDEYI